MTIRLTAMRGPAVAFVIGWAGCGLSVSEGAAAEKPAPAEAVEENAAVEKAIAVIESLGSSATQLDLSSTKVTDVVLAHLKGLTQLETLDLSYTDVTDAGMVHLKGLTALRCLSVRSDFLSDLMKRPRVTSNGVSDLQRALPNVRIVPFTDD